MNGHCQKNEHHKQKYGSLCGKEIGRSNKEACCGYHKHASDGDNFMRFMLNSAIQTHILPCAACQKDRHDQKIKDPTINDGGKSYNSHGKSCQCPATHSTPHTPLMKPCHSGDHVVRTFPVRGDILPYRNQASRLESHTIPNRQPARSGNC